MKKIALIGEIHQDGVNILKKNNFDVVNLSHLPTKSFKFKLRDVDAIVLRTHKLNENDAAPDPELESDDWELATDDDLQSGEFEVG